jgi:hypothetical protein
MAATPVRQPGGYNEPSSIRSSSTGRGGTVNSPRGILGGSGDRSSARDGVPSSSSSVTVGASPWSPQAPPRLQLR